MGFCVFDGSGHRGRRSGPHSSRNLHFQRRKRPARAARRRPERKADCPRLRPPRTDIRQGQTGQRRPELGRSGADPQRRRPGTFAGAFLRKTLSDAGQFLRLGGTAVLCKRHPGLRPAAAGCGTRFDPGYALPARRIHNAAGGPPLRQNGASDRRRAERRHPAAGMVVRRFALSSG